jgi:hypothetical protein
MAQPPLTPEQRQRQREGVLRWQASRTPEEKHVARLKARASFLKAQQLRLQKTGQLPGRIAALNWTSYDEDDR